MTVAISRWLRRLPEVVVGLLALTIGSLTLWMSVSALMKPDATSLSRFELWAVVAFLAGIAIAVCLFGLRLIVPKLRVGGKHVIGIRGLVAFAYFYAAAIVVGLLSGGAAGGRVIVALVMLFAVGTLIYDRLRGPAE